MQNSFLEHEVEKWRFLIFCSVAGFIAFSTNINHSIMDSNYIYHEGEYVGLLWHMRSFYNGEIIFPLLIHGAMDYVPSVLASYFYDDNHVIVGTRAINTVLTGLCWVMFLDLCYLLTSKTSQRVFWMAISLVIFIAIAPPANSHALNVQQAFIGIRDFFLLSAVWNFTKYTEQTPYVSKRFFLIAGTISAVFAFFWGYDRGIFALGFVAVIFLGVLIYKKVLDAVLIVLVVCGCLLILEKMRAFGSLSDNLRNIIYWIKYAAEIFGTNHIMDIPSLIVTTMVLVFCASTILLVFVERSYRNKGDLFLILGIIAIQIILLKTVLNRPSMPRLSWAIWPSILLMIYFSSRRFSLKFLGELPLSVKSNAHVPKQYKAYFLSIVILIFAMSPYFIGHGYFIKNIIKPKPDAEIVSMEMRELSNVLRHSNDQCILGWANEGIVALLAKKRFCTQFPYSIYVSTSEESNYIKQLSADLPMAIVFDVTDSPLLNFDKKSMASRLPNASNFIQDTHLNKQQVGRYLILWKSENNE